MLQIRSSFISACLALALFPAVSFLGAVESVCGDIGSNGICAVGVKFPGSNTDFYSFSINAKSKLGTTPENRTYNGENNNRFSASGFLYYTNLTLADKPHDIGSWYKMSLKGSSYEMLNASKGEDTKFFLNAIAPSSNLTILSAEDDNQSARSLTINGLAIGMGSPVVGSIDFDIKHAYSAPSSLTVKLTNLNAELADIAPISFANKLYVNNGSKIAVETDGALNFRAKMQSSLSLPDNKYYGIDGSLKYAEFYDTDSDNPKNHMAENHEVGIAQNLEIDIKAYSFNNTGQLYISGAKQHAQEASKHTLTRIKVNDGGKNLDENTYNFQNGYKDTVIVPSYPVDKEEPRTVHSAGEMIDAFNNEAKWDYEHGGFVKYTDNTEWEEGRILIRDFANLDVSGSLINRVSGTIALFDGGTLNIAGNFYNKGWIVSGAIDSKYFGYIDVKTKFTSVLNFGTNIPVVTEIEGTGYGVLADSTQFGLMSHIDNPLSANRAYPIIRAEKGLIFVNAEDSEVNFESWLNTPKDHVHLFSGTFENGAFAQVSEAYLENNITISPTLSSDKTTLFISLGLTDEAKAKTSLQLVKEAQYALLVQQLATTEERLLKTRELAVQNTMSSLDFYKDRIASYETIINNNGGFEENKTTIQNSLASLQAQKTTLNNRRNTENSVHLATIETNEARVDELDKRSKISTLTEEEQQELSTKKALLEPAKVALAEWDSNNFTSQNENLVTEISALNRQISDLNAFEIKYNAEKALRDTFENPTEVSMSPKRFIERDIAKAKGAYSQELFNLVDSLSNLLKMPGLDPKTTKEDDGSIMHDGKTYKPYYPSLSRSDFDVDDATFNIIATKYQGDSKIGLNSSDFPEGTDSALVVLVRSAYEHYLASSVYFSREDFNKLSDNEFQAFVSAYAYKMLDVRRRSKALNIEISKQTAGEGIIDRALEAKKDDSFEVLDGKISRLSTQIDEIRDTVFKAQGRLPSKEPEIDKNDILGSTYAPSKPIKPDKNDKINYPDDEGPVWYAQDLAQYESEKKVYDKYQYAFNHQEEIKRACLENENNDLCSGLMKGKIRQIKAYQQAKKYKEEMDGYIREKTNFDDKEFIDAKMEVFAQNLPAAEELLAFLKKSIEDEEGFILEILTNALSAKAPTNDFEKVVAGLGNIPEIAMDIGVNASNEEVIKRVVENVQNDMNNLTKTQTKRTAEKTVSLVGSTLTNNRLAMLSNPIAPDVTLSELIKRMSRQRYAENEVGDVKTDVFLSLQEPDELEKGKNMQLWGSVIGGYASADGTSTIYGGSVGYDTFIGSNLILGGYATYAYVSNKSKQDISNNSHNAQLGLYSRIILAKANELDVFVSHNVGFVHQNRDMKIFNTYRQESDYVSQSSDIGIKYGYAFGVGGGDKPTFFIKPYVSGNFLINVMGNYKEKGLSFEQEGQTNTQANVGAGLEFRKYFKDGGFFFFTPGVDARVYDSQDNVVYKLGGQEIINDIAKKTEVYFVGIIGGEFKMTQSLFGFGSLGAKINGEENYFNGTLGVRYKF